MLCRKLKSHRKYYPIVKHRSRIHHDSTCSCGEEDILGLDEPDDDITPDSENPGKPFMSQQSLDTCIEIYLSE